MYASRFEYYVKTLRLKLSTGFSGIGLSIGAVNWSDRDLADGDVEIVMPYHDPVGYGLGGKKRCN